MAGTLFGSLWSQIERERPGATERIRASDLRKSIHARLIQRVKEHENPHDAQEVGGSIPSWPTPFKPLTRAKKFAKTLGRSNWAEGHEMCLRIGCRVPRAIDVG
jgi:hypothetical protein